MVVAQQDLNSWRSFCLRLSTALQSAESALCDHDLPRVRELLTVTQDASKRMAEKLMLAGADHSPVICELKERDYAAGSASQRWYALMVRDAWEASRDLDREYGEPEGQESRILRAMLTDIEQQLYGCAELV